MTNSRVGFLVLAAGYSRRFGECKLNYQLTEDETVFGRTLNNIIATGNKNICVVAQPTSRLLRSLSDGEDRSIMVVPFASQGIGESIANGVYNTPDWAGWIICLADMPGISSDIYSRMVEEAEQHDIVRPVFRGQPGHPVFFSKKYFRELSQLHGDEGAKTVLQNNKLHIHEIQVDDEGVSLDIDTPGNMQKMHEYLKK